MIDGIPLNVLNGIGVVGICVLILLALARGWLVTGRELANVVHDRDEWRTESRIKDQQIAEQAAQLEHLAEVGRTVEQLARGLQREMP